MNIKHIKRKLLDRFYDPEYPNFSKRQDYLFRKLRYLYKKGDVESLLKILKKEFEISINTITLGEIVKKFRASGINGIAHFAMKNKISMEMVSTILFIFFPERVFPYTKEILGELELDGNTDFLEFQKIIAEIKKSIDFLESNYDLYSLLNLKAKKRDYFEDLKDVISKIKKLDFLKVTRDIIKDIREELEMLTNNEKSLLYSNLNGSCNSYLLRILFEKSYSEVIIDGNNIVHVTLHPSLKNIFDLFKNLARFKYLLFPFTIVFDKNIKYLLPRSELLIFEDRFENNPNVFFHSPADELIFELHISRKAFIVSNDRFREYDIKSSMLLKFKDKKLIY